MLDNSFGSITTKISGSYCDHKSCDEDKLLSNSDPRGSSADDETNSNCNIGWVEQKSIRLDGMNYSSISPDFINHDLTCH